MWEAEPYEIFQKQHWELEDTGSDKNQGDE